MRKETWFRFIKFFFFANYASSIGLNGKPAGSHGLCYLLTFTAAKNLLQKVACEFKLIFFEKKERAALAKPPSNEQVYKLPKNEKISMKFSKKN